jgi:hypothetical protein
MEKEKRTLRESRLTSWQHTHTHTHTSSQPAECVSSCRETREKGDIVFQRLDWLAWQGKKPFLSEKKPVQQQQQSHTSAMRQASIMERETLSFPTDSHFYRQPKKTRLQQGKQHSTQCTHIHIYIHTHTPRRKVSSGDRSSTLGRSSTLLPFRFRISLSFYNPPMHSIYTLYSMDEQCTSSFLSTTQSSPRSTYNQSSLSISSLTGGCLCL